MKQMTSSAKFYAAVAASAVGLILIGGSAVANAAASHSSDPIQALPPKNTTLIASDTEAITAAHQAFVEPQLVEDVLPDFLRAGELAFTELDAQSSRFEGNSGPAAYWSALDQTGRICLVVVPSAVEKYAAMSCAEPSQFDKFGVMLAIGHEEPEKSIGAYLIPDRVALAELPEGFSKAGDTLLLPTVETLFAEESTFISSPAANGRSAPVELRSVVPVAFGE